MKVALPAIQYPKTTTFDPASDLLIAKPEQFDAQLVAGNEMQVRFKRLSSVAKMTIKNLKSVGNISKITFTAKGKNIAGTTTVNLTEGSVTKYGDIKDSDSITLRYSEGLTNGGTAYFCLLPCTIKPGESFTVSVTAGGKVYSRTVTVLEKLKDGLVFDQGKYSAFSVDMSSATETVDENDLEALFKSGQNLTIGLNTYNVKDYPEFQSVKPSKLTEAMLSNGGLIFIDNSDESKLDFTMTGPPVNAGKTKPLIMVGRYKDRKQPVMKVNQLRCNSDVAVMNVHFVSLSDRIFDSTNAKEDPSINLQDCFVEIKRYLVYDNHKERCFKDIDIENCVIKYPDDATNQPALYNFTSTKKQAYNNKTFKVNNCVLFAENVIRAYVLNGGDGNSAKYETKEWDITVTGNTFFNLYQQNIMIRAYTAKSLTVKDNIGYYTGTTAKNYLTGVYDTSFPAASGTVAGNYLYTTPKSDANFWSAKHTGTYTPKSNTIVYDTDQMPFQTTDPSKAYFPRNPSVVTKEIGTDYSTKYYLDLQQVSQQQ